MALLGTLAYLARRVPRQELKTQRPRYPECIRTGTADLVLSLKSRTPAARVTPGASSRKGYDRSSPLIDKALKTLTLLDWFGRAGRPKPATIDRWIRSRREQTGQKLPSGRPPKHHS
jgi:hypothetical protein